MTLRRLPLLLVAAAALPVAVLGSAAPAGAAPSPSQLTVGVAGAAPATASFSGGPITGTADGSGSAAPPKQCVAPACESIPVTVKAPPGYPHKKITLSLEVDFTLTVPDPAGTGVTGLDAYLFDSSGNELGGDTLGSEPSEVEVGQLDPGSYTIEVSGEAAAVNESYTGTIATFPPSVPLVNTTGARLQFAPSTVVSPVILGGEPQITIERPVAQPKAGAGLDPRRGFVDWPVSSRTQIGTLWRTTNGGDSYRQVVDLSCAERQVPNCDTGGGGDTINRVNNYDGTLLYGDQESLAQEAFASSTDHGDTFPPERQYAVTSTGSGVDRQWISAVEAPGIMAGPVVPFELEAIFSYHIPFAGEYVIGVGTDGILRPEPTPVIPLVSQSGPSRIDTLPGSHGFGWFYQSYRDAEGFEVAAAPLSQYQSPQAYHVGHVSSDQPQVFPWIAMDSRGNLYAVWVSTDGQLYYSYSLIDDPANDPTRSPAGIPASRWSPKQKLNPPFLGSTIFPEIVAGDPGHVAITYMATGDYTGISDNAPAGAHPARWSTYLSLSQNGLAPHPTFQVGNVSHRYDHLGSICTAGTTCVVSMGDRSLDDMIDVTMDADGRPVVVYDDNNYAFAGEEVSLGSQGSGFIHVARLTGGPSLRNGHGPYADRSALAYRTAMAGDATWPNTAAGKNLPALDIVGSGAAIDGQDLVARIDLADASAAGIARDLAAYNAVSTTDLPATRLQYVTRWDSEDGQVYYLAADVDGSGTPSFYGGKVDSSNAVNNGPAAAAIAYRPQTAYPVTGKVEGNSLVLRAHLSEFGLRPGSRLLSLSSFSLAGPADELLAGQPDTAQIFATMRDVDASPPLDAVLATGGLGPALSTTTGIPATGSSGSPGIATPNTAGAPAPTGPTLVLLAVALGAGGALGARRRRRHPTGD